MQQRTFTLQPPPFLPRAKILASGKKTDEQQLQSERWKYARTNCLCAEGQQRLGPPTRLGLTSIPHSELCIGPCTGIFLRTD